MRLTVKLQLRGAKNMAQDEESSSPTDGKVNKNPPPPQNPPSSPPASPVNTPEVLANSENLVEEIDAKKEADQVAEPELNKDDVADAADAVFNADLARVGPPGNLPLENQDSTNEDWESVDWAVGESPASITEADKKDSKPVIERAEAKAKTDAAATEKAEAKAKTDAAATEKAAAKAKADAAAVEKAAAKAKADAAAQANLSPTTLVIEKEDALESHPLSPEFRPPKENKITKIHSLGDLHGWAPGLISYLVSHNLAEIFIDGYPMQDESGELHRKHMDEAFPDPMLNFPSLPKSGLKDQPKGKFYGVHNGGHGSIKARWIAKPEVTFVQVGDIFDRADHSELAAEIMRQLIIDAPGKVFALVGNHEQFMLEKDYQNWAHNEVRSAYTDDVKPPAGTRAHFRFFNLEGVTQPKVMQEVFNRYQLSTWTLFLTQGAVLEKLGWSKTRPDWNLSEMLKPGWAPYEHASKHMADHGAGDLIPGALTALVLNDVLFHHGEPAAHKADADGNRLNLQKTIQKIDSTMYNDLRMQMYRHGGYSLQDSIDQPLLWARGSSAGANTGSPAAEQHLSQLVGEWSGLHRIVHGHTPTVGASEFRSQTSGASTTVSYLADGIRKEAEKGRANRVRIHNIDEGMSPVYFKHQKDNPYDPCRVPVGLRIEREEFSPVEASNLSSDLVELNLDTSLNQDRRNLWKWAPRQWKTNAEPSWTEHKNLFCKPLSVDNWRGFVFVEKGPESNKVKETLQRNVLGRTIQDLLIREVLRHATNSPKQDLPAMLERVNPIGAELFDNKPYQSFSKSKVAILLAMPSETQMIFVAYNGTGKKLDFEVGTMESKKRFKATPWEVPGNSGVTQKIEHPLYAYIGLKNTTKSAYNLNTDEKASSQSKAQPSLGYQFSGSAEKMRNVRREYTLPGKPTVKPMVPTLRPTPRRLSAGTSLGSQGEKNRRNQQRRSDSSPSRNNRQEKRGGTSLVEQGRDVGPAKGADMGKANPARDSPGGSVSSSQTSSPSGSVKSNGNARVPAQRRKETPLRDQGNNQSEDLRTQKQKGAALVKKERSGIKIVASDAAKVFSKLIDNTSRLTRKTTVGLRKDARNFGFMEITYQVNTKKLIIEIQKMTTNNSIEIYSSQAEVFDLPDKVPEGTKGMPPVELAGIWEEIKNNRQIKGAIDSALEELRKQ